MSRDHAVVSLGVGGWYGHGVRRLAKSLDDVGFGGTVIGYLDEWPEGCPRHADVPYGFKLWALQRARARGIRRVLWCDASCWALADPAPLFDRVEREGYLFWRCGWSVGEWSTDRSLAAMGLTRDEAMEIPLVVSGIFGLNFIYPSAVRFLGDLTEWSRHPWIFPGPWTNDHGVASGDSRCLGHRHDQTAMSVLVHRYEMTVTDCPDGFAFWTEDPDPRALMTARGGLQGVHW